MKLAEENSYLLRGSTKKAFLLRELLSPTPPAEILGNSDRSSCLLTLTEVLEPLPGSLGSLRAPARKFWRAPDRSS